MSACVSCGAQRAVARGHCGTCYQRERRAGTLAESPRTLAEPGEGHQVVFRLRRSTVEAVRTLAQTAGLSPSEWHRQAVEEKLARETGGERE